MLRYHIFYICIIFRNTHLHVYTETNMCITAVQHSQRHYHTALMREGEKLLYGDALAFWWVEAVTGPIVLRSLWTPQGKRKRDGRESVRTVSRDTQKENEGVFWNYRSQGYGLLVFLCVCEHHFPAALQWCHTAKINLWNSNPAVCIHRPSICHWDE